jgi:PAP2 superfamily
MRLLSFLLAPAVLGSIALFASIVWMLRNEKDKVRPMLVLALTLNLFFGFLLTVFMSKEGSLLPLKYDYVLFHLDKALGLETASIASLLQGAPRVPLIVIYQLMVPMMICWALVTHYGRARGSVVLAYVAELIVGPLFYALLPACGPVYAFRPHWLQPTEVPSASVHLTGMPNAFPSLHVATALIFVLFAPGRIARGGSLIFLAGTILATLSTGEHYIIDLVVGLAFGCFAAAVGHRESRKAIVFISVTLFWSLTIRFASGFWIGHAVLLRLLAVLTVILAFSAVSREWTIDRITEQALPPRAPEAADPAAELS